MFLALIFHVLLAVNVPTKAYWWDAMVRSNFTYDEQVTAYAAQGLMNALNMMLFFNIGDMNFDWHKADMFWKGELAFEKYFPII